MIISRFEQKIIWEAILDEYKLKEKRLAITPQWNKYKNCIKPVFDFGFAFLLFLAVSPIVILTAIYLFFSNKGNVFFLQKRPGIDGKIFTIIKFKTMNDKKDALGNLLPDSERLTTIGKWIRKTSVDELPQLINVLKGEMSIVGPRPLLPEYLDVYTDFQKRRHHVKPGITGMAQINGRNAIDWETKLKFDVWYVDHHSFQIDFKILFHTIIKVLKYENINPINIETIKPFYGK
jgi:lipopolysaccharide/colanic/teichoic acid biosynthesis glycosyltransferase